MNQRQSEMKLYRTLGMSHRQLRLTIWAEFGLIALAAGLVSGGGADALVAVLVTYGFDLTAHPHYIVWILQPIVALLMVMFIVVRFIPPSRPETSIDQLAKS
ncbi:FtsX-like permease family protein [Vibrio sp. PP-XX7]